MLLFCVSFHEIENTENALAFGNPAYPLTENAHVQQWGESQLPRCSHVQWKEAALLCAALISETGNLSWKFQFMKV